VEKPQLLQLMTDAYLARRRRGSAFDDTAAIQAFWECASQMSAGQAQAFKDAGKGDRVAGWKVVLRGRLAVSEGLRRS
jgi:hypothetical protein